MPHLSLLQAGYSRGSGVFVVYAECAADSRPLGPGQRLVLQMFGPKSGLETQLPEGFGTPGEQPAIRTDRGSPEDHPGQLTDAVVWAEGGAAGTHVVLKRLHVSEEGGSGRWRADLPTPLAVPTVSAPPGGSEGTPEQAVGFHLLLESPESELQPSRSFQDKPGAGSEPDPAAYGTSWSAIFSDEYQRVCFYHSKEGWSWTAPAGDEGFARYLADWKRW